ncbi:MAG: D-alanyl-D-alanine carboxypeptidase family protein, partial [Clostridia bacterium]|nr:D-alanyl-D-alanine carboxypeptidase family protein [Clostridia bacterium]
WEYGYILRYPKEKESITGYIYEPWHIRYVGTEAALEIRDLGVTFEEYIQMIRGKRVRSLEQEEIIVEQNTTGTDDAGSADPDGNRVGGASGSGNDGKRGAGTDAD